MTPVAEAGPKMDSTVLPVVRRSHPWRTRLLRSGILMVIFLAGGVAGYCVGTMQLIERLTQPDTAAKVGSSGKFTEWIIAQLKKDLSLTEEQAPLVENIIRRHHEAFDRIRKDVQPRFAREMASMDRDMRQVLNESQRALWQKRMERMDPSRGPRQRPPGGSHGPGREGGFGPDRHPGGERSRERSGGGTEKSVSPKDGSGASRPDPGKNPDSAAAKPVEDGAPHRDKPPPKAN